MENSYNGRVADPVKDNFKDDNFAEGVGYNLKTGEADDMLKQHIIDPAIVIREAVINSHSVISKLITTQMALAYEDREWQY